MHLSTVFFVCVAAFVLQQIPFSVQAQEAGPDPMTIQTFAVQYADLDDLRNTVEPLAGTKGRVTVNRAKRQLVVMARPHVMKIIEDLVQQLDVLPKNVRIRVRFNDASASRLTEAGARTKGGIVLTNGDVGGRVSVKPFLVNQQTTSSSLSEQNLMVMSGRNGTLRVGERIPYAEYFIQYGMHHGYIDTQIQWQDVGASLLIEPTVIGDGPMVHVRLIPEISANLNGHPQRIQYASAATEVTVEDGQTLSLGGLNKDEEFYSRFLLGFSKGGESRQLDILLTPEILTPGKP
jgi:type II secretory pathway component GspD/PulD (secretin)